MRSPRLAGALRVDARRAVVSFTALFFVASFFTLDFPAAFFVAVAAFAVVFFMDVSRRVVVRLAAMVPSVISGVQRDRERP